MNDEETELVAELAKEFLARCRQGQRPALSEYIRQHPKLESEIREIFPMMLLMEDVAAEPKPERDDLASLEKLGDFKIHRVIGRGGMGVVYEATQESLGRRVALKVCPLTQGMSSRNRERFRRESRAAAMLHHTNIVPVFAVGEEGGMLYYAMQFISGATLDDVIQELRLLWQTSPTSTTRLTRGVHSQPSSLSKRHEASAVAHSLVSTSGSRPSSVEPLHRLPNAESNNEHIAEVHLPGQSSNKESRGGNAKYWDSVARIGVQVAEALVYAHGKGTLHRDIKPANLMLDQAGVVWVMDFGLAKSLEEDDLTREGEVIGTLRYMAPEQCKGVSGTTSDIYSLGLTLYEMLALRPAYEELHRTELLRAITENDPIPPRKINRHVPRDLETIVMKAIEREPTRRYATAQELADELERFLSDEPIRARPVSATERVGKWIRRRPAIATLTAALALVFVVSFALVSWKWREAERERAVANTAAAAEQEAREDADAQRSLAVARLDDAEQALYRSSISRAEATSRTAPDTARELLANLIPAAGEVDRRDWEWGYLNTLLNQEVAVMQCGASEAEWIRSLAFSQDETLLAVGSGRTGFSQPQNRSPKGRVTIWSTRTAELIAELPIEHTAYSLAFSSDNRRLTVSEPVAKNHMEATWSGGVTIWDVESASPICELEQPDKANRLRYLAYCSDDGIIVGSNCTPMATYGWHAQTGELLWTIRSTELVAVDADSESLLLSRHQPTRDLVRFRISDLQELEVVSELPKRTPPLTTRLGLLGCKLDTFRFDLERFDGQRTLLWGDDQYKVTTTEPLRPICAVHPADNIAAVGAADGTVRAWNTDTGELQRIYRGHAAPVQAVAYSPSGRWLASGDWSGEVRLWQPGRFSHTINLEPRNQLASQCYVEDLAFRFDGANVVGFAHLLDANTFGDAQARGRVTNWDSERGLRLGEAVVPPSLMDVRRRQAEFAANGTRLAMVGNDNVLRVVEFESNAELFSFDSDDITWEEISISSDGARLAAYGSRTKPRNQKQSHVAVWDIATQKLIRSLEFPPAVSLALDTTGKRLAVAFKATNGQVNPQPAGVRICNVDGGSMLQTVGIRETRDESDVISTLAFSPSDQLLAVCWEFGKLSIHETKNGKAIMPCRNVPEVIEDIAWHPGGKRLAGASRESVTIWDLDGNEILVLKGRPRYGDMPFDPAIAFSPDGSKVAATQWDNSINVWKATGPNSHRFASEDSIRFASRDAFAIENMSKIVAAVPGNPWYLLGRGQVGALLRPTEETQADYVKAKQMLTGEDRCLLLHGDAFIKVPSLPLHTFEGHTIEAWIKHWNYMQPGYCYGVIAAQYPRAPTEYFAFQEHRSLNELDRMGWYWLRPTEEYANVKQQWTHVAVTFGPEELRYYMNGTYIGNNRPQQFNEAMSDFFIGDTDLHNPHTKGRGLIRSLRVSQGELYQGTEGFVPPVKLGGAPDGATALLFDFEQDSSQPNSSDDPRTIIDRSGNQRHGILHNAWWLEK
ncbi:MAG: protein kinase [Pirellulaceae bacterium]